jgi:hypothetical protein
MIGFYRDLRLLKALYPGAFYPTPRPDPCPYCEHDPCGCDDDEGGEA